MPMSIYFGWITVATPLNIASVLNAYGFTQAITTIPWVLFWIGAAYVTSVIVFSRLRYISYFAVMIRALIGVIAVRHYDQPFISWIAILLVLLSIVIISIRSVQKKVTWL
jgi:hypothetical protein